VANINVDTIVTPTPGPVLCDELLDFEAAGFPIVNINPGGSLWMADVNDCSLTLEVQDLNVRAGGKISVNKSLGNGPGKVTVNATGTINVEAGAAITAIGGAGAPNPTIELFATDDIDIAGLLEARGLSARAFGGHIIIESSAGKVTVEGSAKVISGGADPGGTLIVIRACEGIDVFGVLDASSRKRAAEILLSSRETIRIIDAKVVADTKIGELSPGEAHRITIEARDDITIESSLISADSGRTNKDAGDISVLSTEGSLTCDAASLFSAEARAGGSRGGSIALRSFENVGYNCTSLARGGRAGNGSGGTIVIQSFTGDVTGAGKGQATGQNPGTIVLKAAANPISNTGIFNPPAIRQPGMPEASPKTILPCGAPIPNVKLEKLVNGNPADVCPGISVAPGSTLNYEYRVTNTGQTVLVSVQVTDNRLGPISTIPRLDPGQTISLFAQSTAPASGQLQNVGTVVGTPANAAGAPLGLPTVTDTNSACVTVPGPAIDLEKLVNGQDADVCPGVSVAAGSTLSYEYRVKNTGNTVLINVNVSDNILGAIGTIPRLDPGQTTSLFAQATAPASGQRENIGTVVGTPANAAGVSLGLPNVTDTDPACATVPPGPAIDLKKSVNGDPADVCPGLSVAPSSSLTYEYKITNIGNTVLINVVLTDNLLGTIGTVPRLDPGQTTSLFAFATAPASGQRENIGTVVGTPASAAGVSLGLPNVSDQDRACVTVPTPAINIEKLVNGQDADVCPGVNVTPGSSLTYEYKITNIGNTVLINVAVTDNLLGTIGTIPRLDPGQATSLFAQATAPASGQRENIGTVVGTPANAAGVSLGLPNVTDTDPACATVFGPAIDLEKFVNGQDADVCPGVSVAANASLTYEYKVTNTGNTVLVNVVVTDDLLGTIGTVPRLDPGQATSVFAFANAPASGQRRNVGTVVGTPANAAGVSLGLPNVTDTDPACATVPPPPPVCSIDLEKTASPDQITLTPVVCEGGITQITFRYTGEPCSATTNLQGRKLNEVCKNGEPNFAQPVKLVVTGKEASKVTVNPSGQTVNVGDLVTFTTTGDKLKSDLTFDVRQGTTVRQSLKVHVSCSQPIAPGDKFGSMQVVSFTSKDGGFVSGGTTVDYSYKVRNTGSSTVVNVAVNDNLLGPIGTIPSIPPGGVVTLTDSDVINQTTTNIATASGSVQGSPGVTCSDQAQATVTVSPPPAPFVCSDAKPLNTLTMIWDGTQNIKIVAHKGSLTAQVLATIDNIQPGDEVTVTGFAGSPNDVVWELFRAGTNTSIGKSTFHLSCSDVDMNGSEDCGKREGDGKGLSGFINDWLFEGMAGNGKALDCTP
jgi:hypothetical protein